MDKNKLYKESKHIIDSFLETPSQMIDVNKWKGSNIIIIDMINGFAKKGNLYSERVEKIIENTQNVLNAFDDSQHLFLCDSHSNESIEFETFLPHCEVDSEETEIVDELKEWSDNGLIIKKNSTNGFIEPEFQKWLSSNKNSRYLIAGCCTDLCILQFVLTLKTHYNRINQPCEIMVIENATETYHVDEINHPGDFMHLISLKMLKDNGILLGRI